MLQQLILRGFIALTLVTLTACKQEGGAEVSTSPDSVNSPTLPGDESNISAPSPRDSIVPVEAVSAPNGAVRIVEETEGGGTVLIGDFTAVGTVAAPGVAFLDASGKVDSERQSAIGSGPTGKIETVEQLDDGTLLLGGNLSTFNGQPVSNVVALNATGQIDPIQTAALGSKSTGGVSAIAVSATGEVALLGGPENTDAVVIVDPNENTGDVAAIGNESTDSSILDALKEKKDQSCPALLAELSALKKQVNDKKSALRAAQSDLKKTQDNKDKDNKDDKDKDESKKHAKSSSSQSELTTATRASIKQLSKELKSASAAHMKQSKIIRAAKCGAN